MIPTLRLGGLGNASVAATGGGSTVPVSSANCASLLHMDGTNGSTTFTDYQGHTWAPTSTTISTAQSKFGGASGSFNSGYITGPSGSAVHALGTDWTFTCWIRSGDVSNYFTLFDTRFGGAGIAIYGGGPGGSAGKLGIYDNTSLILEGAGLVTNTQTHIEVGRTGGTIYAFIDGVSIGTVADARTYAGTTTAIIGANYLGGQNYQGYMDEVLIMNGECLHTSNFTPPAFPYALV